MADLSELIPALIATAGAIVAAWAATTRPMLAIGALFLLASLSRLVIDTPVGTMRLEQPAIAVVAIVLLVRGRLGVLRSVSRTELAIAGAFAGYLAVLAVSSAIRAPQPIESLRLVAWLAISMVGGGVVYVLARPTPPIAVPPFAFAGAAKGAVGIVVAAAFLVFGPGADWGIQEAQGILPRVHAFTWEANIYASFLAIVIPFALEMARGPRRLVGFGMLALIAVGLPLGATRGAYLGAIAGVGAYVLIRVALEKGVTDLWRSGPALAGSLVIGFIAAGVLLPNALQRYEADTRPLPTPAPIATGGIPASGGPSTLPTEPPPPTPSIGPPPSLRPYPDTISFRLDRVPIALDDLRQSPWIGLGAESYGQRHADVTQGGAPDHIAILAVAAVYDAGIIGASFLALAFVLLLIGLWRASRSAARGPDTSGVGLAAAFAGAIVALLVTSQATNALHFASNWMIIGAAIAVIGAARSRSKA